MLMKQVLDCTLGRNVASSGVHHLCTIANPSGIEVFTPYSCGYFVLMGVMTLVRYSVGRTTSCHPLPLHPLHSTLGLSR